MPFLDTVRKVLSDVTTPSVGKQERGHTLARIELGERVFNDPFRNRIFNYPVLGTVAQIRLYKTQTSRVGKVLRRISDRHFKKYLDELDKTLMKQEFIGYKFLERSYKFFQTRYFYNALRCSNLGLMFMPADSPSVPRLYANRAAIFFKLKEYKESLNDAEVALVLPKESPIEYSLIKQLHILKRTSRKLHQKKSNSKVSVRRFKKVKKRKQYCKENLYRIFGEQNASISSAGSCISIVENPSKGRTLEFTQNLKSGTTIIVEDPYIAVLSDAVKFETSHCSKCFKKILSVVPCNECVFASYCSRKCRQDDRNLHKYECPCLTYFHAIQLAPTYHLAFRAICKAGPEFMYMLFEQTKDGAPEASSSLPMGFNPKTRIYESNSYFQLYNLIHHDDGSSIEFQNWLAYSMAKLLQIRTGFFQGIKKENLRSFFDFVKSAILQNLMSFPFNVVSLWHAPEDNLGPESEDELKVTEYRTLLGIFSLSSLMCHSCDPTGLRINLDSGKMAIVTSRRVSAGEELTISYGYEYTTHPKHVRDHHLEEHYYFKCDCVACLYDWPMRSDISIGPSYLCPECGPKTPYSDIVTFNTTLHFDEHLQKGKCKKCSHEYIMQDLADQVHECFKKVVYAQALIERKNPLKALPIIVGCLEFLHGRIRPPAIQISEAQEVLYAALDEISTSDPYKTRQRDPKIPLKKMLGN